MVVEPITQILENCGELNSLETISVSISEMELQEEKITVSSAYINIYEIENCRQDRRSLAYNVKSNRPRKLP